MTSRDHLKSLSDAQLIKKLRESEYSHLMQEAADRLEREQWQPIETAPKDHQHILIAVEIVASAYHGTRKKGDHLYWQMTSVSTEDLEENIYLEDAGFNAQEFSHWRPLPQPPARR